MSELTIQDYNELDGKSVVMFYADWCYPCNRVKPGFIELSESVYSHKFMKCNIDEENELAATNRIRTVPTFIVMDGKTEVSRTDNLDELRKTLGLIDK